jgi:hypothetical protein
MNQSRSFVIRLPWRLILYSIVINSWQNCYGFQVLHSSSCHTRRRHTDSNSCQLRFPHQSWILWNHEDSKDSTSSESDGSTMDNTFPPRISSRRRVGGRSKSFLGNKGRDDMGRNIFLILSRFWKQWMLPMLVAGFLVSSLFGRIGSQTQQSYVFYQSNVYETRMVGSDGKIQTSRQETIRTNLPQALRATQTESRESNFVLTEDDFDIRELEQDMKSMWENLLF